MKTCRRILPTLLILVLLSLFCTVLASAETVITVTTANELSTAVGRLADTGGTVRLGCDITLSASLTLPENRARITLDGDGYTLFLRSNLALSGDMDIKNICFYNYGTYRSIPCGGHDVHFFDTVTCDKSATAYPSIMAGYTTATDFSGGNLTIDGGTWQRVRGGNASASAAVQSGSVTVNGGSIVEYLQVCGAGQSLPGSAFDVTVNGGSVNNIYFFSTTATAAADTTLTINGGEIGGKILPSTRTGTLNGSCAIRIADGSFAKLTRIAGYSGAGNLAVTLSLAAKLAKDLEDRSVDTLSGTLLRTGVADPCVLYTNGCYYLTMTGTSNIALIKSATLEGLASGTLGSNLVYKSASDATATDTFGYTEINGTWSPELHCFDAADFGEDYAGWYMYLALRKKGDDSSNIRMVALKSKGGDTPDGPYVHPTTKVDYASQPILDRDGNIIAEWGCGMSILRIESGAYRGIYAMWVAEEKRGTPDFIQKIMIAKLKSPWQLAEEPKAILTPTQYWETIGSGYDTDRYYPAVVEGATALYGKNGEVYLIYCGSGYWTNYGLGQLTWNGGDPTLAASWVKYADNPVFGANDKNGNHYYGVKMQGAGHAFFLRDAADNLFAVYHAYPADASGNKIGAKPSRNAYMEPCYIDYTKSNGAGMGVLTFAGGKIPADTGTAVQFTTAVRKVNLLSVLDENLKSGTTLALAAKLTATAKSSGILLDITVDAAADGCEIRRKAAGDADFTLLATLQNGETAYTDETVSSGVAYTYIAIPYVASGDTPVFGTASAAETVTLTRPATPTVSFSLTADSKIIGIFLSSDEAVDSYRIYKADAADGEETKTLLAETTKDLYLDTGVLYEHTYIYTVTAVRDGVESKPTEAHRVYVPTPRLKLTSKTVKGGGILLGVTDSGSADSYKFSRGADDTQLADSAAMTYLDTDVEPEKSYVYFVRAYENGVLVGFASASCTAGVPHPTLSVTTENEKTAVRIPAIAGAAQFKLYKNDVLWRDGDGSITFQFREALADGRYTLRLDALDEDGTVFDSVTQILRVGAPYDAAYDANGDGVCNIADALLTLRGVLDGAGGTLADVLKILRFIAG